MTSLPPFITLWILVEFASSLDEGILMIKVWTKREKRPKTGSFRFDILCYEWRQLHSVLFISVEYFCHRKWILSRSVLWNSQIKIIKISLVLKIWDKWYNKWIITQGAGTPCFFRMLTTVFLSYLKTNFTLKCLQIM